MLFGRFAMIVPILALAGSLARKKLVAAKRGHFSGLRPAVHHAARRHHLLVGALTFFRRSSLGPIVEHFLMHAGKLF